MGFRQSKAEVGRLARFHQQHFDALTRLGLPADIVRDWNRWCHFIGHGIDHDTKWTVQSLVPAKRRSLLAFLQAHFPADIDGLRRDLIDVGLVADPDGGPDA
jgi:hypothetical protein